MAATRLKSDESPDLTAFVSIFYPQSLKLSHLNGSENDLFGNLFCPIARCKSLERISFDWL